MGLYFGAGVGTGPGGGGGEISRASRSVALIEDHEEDTATRCGLELLGLELSLGVVANLKRTVGSRIDFPRGLLLLLRIQREDQVDPARVFGRVHRVPGGAAPIVRLHHDLVGLDDPDELLLLDFFGGNGPAVAVYSQITTITSLSP
jgi:hypothetical protein